MGSAQITSKTSASVDVFKIKDTLIVSTFFDNNGDEVDKIMVPGCPPAVYRAPVATPSMAAVTLLNVPAFTWSFGCSATSAAMVAGYYDNPDIQICTQAQPTEVLCL